MLIQLFAIVCSLITIELLDVLQLLFMYAAALIYYRRRIKIKEFIKNLLQQQIIMVKEYKYYLVLVQQQLQFKLNDLYLVLLPTYVIAETPFQLLFANMAIFVLIQYLNKCIFQTFWNRRFKRSPNVQHKSELQSFLYIHGSLLIITIITEITTKLINSPILNVESVLIFQRVTLFQMWISVIVYRCALGYLKFKGSLISYDVPALPQFYFVIKISAQKLKANIKKGNTCNIILPKDGRHTITLDQI
ncbi:Hypothetical_protein [Hexamita inflata]|uniref:Hypothetical_protein n=1 Tax=Hexamita inflata TaxID=28002 RepID=A0AA86U1T7_9EUKA|nr:Hypothetical protein HINF_LOCUS15648 [Hexamita inflata]